MSDTDEALKYCAFLADGRDWFSIASNNTGAFDPKYDDLVWKGYIEKRGEVVRMTWYSKQDYQFTDKGLLAIRNLKELSK